MIFITALRRFHNEALKVDGKMQGQCDLLVDVDIYVAVCYHITFLRKGLSRCVCTFGRRM